MQNGRVSVYSCMRGSMYEAADTNTHTAGRHEHTNTRVYMYEGAHA
jgi:hypothetical protein